ncbi:hypothetical protein EP331_07415 [bacterium]|nr:MAG: hypothetical protein EP331_07415 [bacterium]
MIKIRSGLKQFMFQIIDYAGMYPPARLDFASAFANYLHYQNQKYHWMLERFVFPIQETASLEQFSDELAQHKHKIKLSTLPTYSNSSELFLSGFMTDLTVLSKTIKQLPASFDFRFFEFKLPHDLMHAEQKTIYDFITQLIVFAKDHPLTDPKFFIEIHIDEDWKYNLNRFIKLLKHHPYAEHLGFKLRCGGITSDAFPEAEIVATAIYLSRQHNLPIKFTAGLHHPIRHYNDSVQAKMYGFFNIFGASIIANKYSLTIDELEEILVDEKPEHFTFSDQGMKWRELEVPTKEIKQARETLCFSYGSCSFDEPREDLHKLHLL